MAAEKLAVSRDHVVPSRVRRFHRKEVIEARQMVPDDETRALFLVYIVDHFDMWVVFGEQNGRTDQVVKTGHKSARALILSAFQFFL